jgi:isoleucyl-tRNA synthetase
MRSSIAVADNFADQYKNSIHLPKTSFPMKGNLPQTEPQKIEDWAQIGIYEKLIKRNEGRPLFVMPDGPPYANGSLHLGHVLNKVLKDIVIKFKNMSGYQAAFIPGWDCHGLPIELNVTKKLGDKRSQMSDAEVRQLCRQEALSWVEKQKKQFVRLGILGDWDHPYLTLQPQYEAEEVRVLAQILENGVLYRGEKPVYWCPRSSDGPGRSRSRILGPQKPLGLCQISP